MATPRVLSRVREVIGKTFNTTAQVLRKTRVADTSGGSTDTYSVVATYPCSIKIYPVRPMERESGERIQSVRAWQFAFPSSAVIVETDRLQTPDGRIFEIVGSGHDSMNIVLLITAQEII